MTIGQLIQRLREFTPTQEVMILDSFNGGGHPRTINFGPGDRVVDEHDVDSNTDCSEFEGQTVVVMGYGCY